MKKRVQTATPSGTRAMLNGLGKTGVPAGDLAAGQGSRFGGRKKLLCSFLLALCAGCTEEATVSADQALDNMLAAIAPERSRGAVQSLTATAEGMGPQGAHEITVTSIRPDTVYFRRASERGITEIWSTAERTWGGDVGEEYATMTSQVREFVRGHEFHLMLIDLKRRFSEFELQDREKLASTECLRIAMTNEAGESASICIRVDNWLPEELRLHNAGGPVQVAFSDWRETEGLKLFHALELREEQDRVFTYDYVNILVNTFAFDVSIPAYIPKPELPAVQKGASE